MAFWCKGKKDYCNDTSCEACNKCKFENGSGGIELEDDATDGIIICQWISVKDRLPEDDQRVLFVPTCNQGSVYTGQFALVGRDGGVMFAHREGRAKVNYYAKYWMPLPGPPKEDADA